MTLLSLLVLTDRHQAAGRAGASRPATAAAGRPWERVCEVVAAAIDAGARGVVLREKDLPPSQRAALAAAMAPVVHDAGGLLLSGGDALSGCDGVHLPASGWPSSAAPAGRSAGSIVGRSCHDAGDLSAAERGGADYVTLSPVFLTASKPGYGPALGTERLAALVARTTVAVYALGGIETPEQVRSCRQAGAAGVAVMGAVMRADDPGRVVRALLRAGSEAVP